ncbi:MAG: SBBP repeat-containing protein [Candidatus Hodarchaeota archaeon]
MLLRSLFLIVLILILCTEACSQDNVCLRVDSSITYQTIEARETTIGWWHPDQVNWNLVPGKVHSVTERQASSQFTDTPSGGSWQIGLQACVQAKNTDMESMAIQVVKSAQVGSPMLDFSTYIGGSDWEHIRDICADNQGNIYITGGTASTNFPTTPGAYDRTFDPGHTGSFGPCDVFVTKFDPNGNLVWSTFLGGSAYDRGYGIEVDNQGYVYVAGRAGPGFPTKNAFQSTFQGSGTPSTGYGEQNAFVAKIKPDGSDLVWSSYVGVGSMCRDMAIDDNGDIYVPLTYDGSPYSPPTTWFTNAYQKTRKGGEECGAVKIKSDGSQVLWATWLGGSGDDSGAASIRVDGGGYVYVETWTKSTDMPTTPGVHDQTHNGGDDYYVAKLTPDGSGLVFGTYLGGSRQEIHSTHNLAIDDQGNAYVSVWTSSADFPTTAGAFCRKHSGGGAWGSDIAIAKFSPTGVLLASTFIGGGGDENPDGIYADEFGNVFLTGHTFSTNFPVTNNAYQPTNRGGKETVLVKLSADFSQLIYSTYMGGSSNDDGRTSFLGSDGNWYLAGQSSSTDWPTMNAFQDYYGGGDIDGIVAKFSFSDPTPVELVSLTAVVSNNTVELIWKTSSESNNLGFEVERSQNRVYFTKIGFVAGQGTTAISHQYSFVDKNLLSGTYYYRLKQIDIGGRFEYSSIVEVIIDLPREFMLYQNYPNPFNPVTTIKYQLPLRSQVKLVILNLLGEEVTTLADTTQGPGVYQVQWDASGLSSGVYWYKLEAGNFSQTKKILFFK